MRKILILFILLASTVLWAKDRNKNKIKHILPGRWVEVKRLKTDSTVVPFTDTLFMAFYMRDSFNYRLRNGFVYKGKYTFNDDNHLEFGTASYEVALKRPTSLILTNTMGIYYFGVDTSDTAAVVKIDSADKILPVTEIDSMIGHWSVYKTDVAKDGAEVDYSVQIKSVYITGQGSDDKKGYLYCGNDGRNSPSFYIKALGTDQSLECAGKAQRFVKVVKCQKGELVLEENGMSYYFKQFK